MRKILLFLCFSIAAAGTASAQKVWIKAGPELGLNFTNMTLRYEDIDGDKETETADMKVGVKVGGVVDINIGRHFAIQPGLYFSQKGYANEFGTLDYSYRVNYLEMPVNFLFKTRPSRAGRFFAGGGPYVAVAVGGEYEDEDGNDESLEFGNDDDDDLRGADVGMNFTAGYELPFGLFFRGNFGVGFANLIPDGDFDDDTTLRNWGFGLSVGFLFGH